MPHHKNELQIPPGAVGRDIAREVLRVWAVPEEPQRFTLRRTYEDPAAWGLLLVDIARHVAMSYQHDTARDYDDALRRIRQAFDAEWEAPTSAAMHIIK
jgi:hypothetical protein